ncbi:hypothetical protein SAMD00079811_47590 [Scytonema sp. HK-05]|nr:hypothetical protein SAMD00079811_47590 [Scytonema sp. HK-05]
MLLQAYTNINKVVDQAVTLNSFYPDTLVGEDIELRH